MGHAFDTQNRCLDKNGFDNNWWTDTTNNTYLEKIKCFIEKYNLAAEKIGVKVSRFFLKIFINSSIDIDDSRSTEAEALMRTWLTILESGWHIQRIKTTLNKTAQIQFFLNWHCTPTISCFGCLMPAYGVLFHKFLMGITHIFQLI